MLTIRHEQMQALERRGFERFLDKLVASLGSEEETPVQREQLRTLAEQARGYDLKSEAAIAGFITLLLEHRYTGTAQLSKQAQNCLYAYRVPEETRLQRLEERLAEEALSSRVR